ncbi:MAG: pyruvate carboxylase subunit B [Archaeoglobales archaeon]|nr:MAG: pyruvate carboxylase subunit B [Archaeoglobales archaeon]
MEEVKRELLKAVEKLFDDYLKSDVSYEKVRWELDYVVYPGIGSFLADGSLTKEEGKEIFEYCEKRLQELKLRLEFR